MDLREKIATLGESAQYDLCTSSGAPPALGGDHDVQGLGSRPGRKDFDRWIYRVARPDGQRLRVLKVLMTNVCTKRCYYCGIRASRDVPRASFEPEELACAFDRMHRAGIVDGIFLSSAVCSSADSTMDRMIASVELLRGLHQFAGYIHLKLLPGCSEAHVERAVQLAQRVSVNLEAPNAERLAAIAPHKIYLDELMRPMRIAKRLIDDGDGRLAPAGQSTQFVVGAAGEPDREILATSASLYRELGLARAYYSAFNPVPGTPLDGKERTPAWREHRIYQADWLLRFYGFDFEDLVFDDTGNLHRAADPKLAYAHHHPEAYPVEVNRASREALLRVPGLGPRTVSRLLHWRRQGRLRELEHLSRAGAVAERAAPFVLLDGVRPPHQLSLWSQGIDQDELDPHQLHHRQRMPKP